MKKYSLVALLLALCLCAGLLSGCGSQAAASAAAPETAASGEASTDAAGEKHVPVIEVNGETVTVQVGSVEHPSLPAHCGGSMTFFMPDVQVTAAGRKDEAGRGTDAAAKVRRSGAGAGNL